MPKLKLTATSITKLKAPHFDGKQTCYWDDSLPGFGVLVSGLTTSRSYVAQRDLPNGKTRRVTIAAVGEIDLDKAREEAADVLHSLRKGVDPKSNRRGDAIATLREVLEDFLAKRRDLRETSRRNYRIFVEKYLSDWLDHPLRDITPDMVEQRHSAIQKDIAQREGKRRSSATGPATTTKTVGGVTANMVMTTLQILWGYWTDKVPDFPPSPVSRLKRQWFPVTRRQRMVPIEALPKFFAAIDTLPSRTARDFLLLSLWTGLRKNEAASLRWSDIDLVEKVLRIPAERTKTGVPLALPLSAFLHRLLVSRRALGLDGEFVFASNSKAGYLAEPKFPLDQVSRVCGITATVHDLRRTFASIAEGVVSGIELKRMLNHSSDDTTEGYVLIDSRRLREAVERVSQKLEELCAVPKPAGENVAALQR